MPLNASQCREYPAATTLATTAASVALDETPFVITPSKKVPAPQGELSPPTPSTIAPSFLDGSYLWRQTAGVKSGRGHRSASHDHERGHQQEHVTLRACGWQKAHSESPLPSSPLPRCPAAPLPLDNDDDDDHNE